VTVKDKDLDWALFWCSLLDRVIHGEIDREDEEAVRSFLKAVASEERLYPNGVRKKPPLTTLKRKLDTYFEKGFEGLARKPRSDRGKPRAHSEAMVKRAVAIKRDQACRSHVAINKFLEVEFGKRIPKSTLYQHLKAAGATRIKLGVSKKKVRCRWTRDYSNALWLGDFEDGPYVLYGEQAVPTHLSLFIDCHSRDIIEGRYYYCQKLSILVDSFLRALATHGAPSELYVDRAKVYQSKALRAVCRKIPIKLRFRPIRDPPAGGAIERAIQTIQSQFETEVRRGEIMTLEELNRAFAAWIAKSYRCEPNSDTGQAPGERYEQGLREIRRVDMAGVIPYFMRRERRTVDRTFSDVRLNNRFYRVDKRLRGDRVEVRYDPFGDEDMVLIYSLREEYLGKGRRHNREKGEGGAGDSPQHKPQFNYLQLLIQEHEKDLRAKTQGIDYRGAVTSRRLSFSSFTATFAELLGRKGGVSAFSTQELEFLQKLYNRTLGLSKALLMDAFEHAREKTLLAVGYELQQLARRKE
jgi:transposase InsO family protein